MKFQKLNKIGKLHQCKARSISELSANRNYRLIASKRIDTRFGPRIIVTIDDTELEQVFLPARFGKLSEEDYNVFQQEISTGMVYMKYLGGPQQLLEFFELDKQVQRDVIPASQPLINSRQPPSAKPVVNSVKSVLPPVQSIVPSVQPVINDSQIDNIFEINSQELFPLDYSEIQQYVEIPLTQADSSRDEVDNIKKLNKKKRK